MRIYEVIFKNLIGVIYNNNLQKENYDELLNQFKVRYDLLSRCPSGDLLVRLKTGNIKEQLLDTLTEFNLAYEILSTNNGALIEYEPYGGVPDILVKTDKHVFFIQIKRMRESAGERGKSLKEYGLEPSAYLPKDDAEQIRLALDNAVEKTVKELPEGVIFITARESMHDDNVGNDTYSAVLYGAGGKGGYFESRNGKLLDAFISLEKKRDTLFSGYDKFLFINGGSQKYKDALLSLIPGVNEVYQDGR